MARFSLLLCVAVIGASKPASAYYSGADGYASMSDIDWGKRGDADWILPAYNYGSMADSDWGWKKRAAPSAAGNGGGGDDDDDDVNKAYPTLGRRSAILEPAWRNYYSYLKSQSPYYAAASHRRHAAPAAPAAAPTASSSSYMPVALASSRRSPMQKQYNYHSMADLDWGWRRKRAGAAAARVSAAARKSYAAKRHVGSLHGAANPQYKY